MCHMTRDAVLRHCLTPARDGHAYAQSAFRERKETLRTVKDRAAALSSAVNILDAGLRGSRTKVHVQVQHSDPYKVV